MNGPNEQAELFEKAQQDRFDEFYKINTSPGSFGKATKRLHDAAHEKTRDMREAVSDARQALATLNKAFNLRWQQAWRAERDEMVAEAVNAQMILETSDAKS
jgi:hypothetical protein